MLLLDSGVILEEEKSYLLGSKVETLQYTD